MSPLPIRQDAETLAGYRRDASGLEGLPAAALRARDVADVAEAIAWARAHKQTVLPVGAQTSTTGASVADGGLLLDLTGLDRPPELNESRDQVRVGPGTRVQALRAWLQAQGLDFPVDPTSASSCTVGGAIATNASGPASFRYGSMASWVRSVDLIDGRGRAHSLRRREVGKCAMGPRALQDPVDFVVGSEGTLGVITGATLAVHVAPTDRAGVLLAFADRPALIAAVIALRPLRKELRVRSIEWLDGTCCDLVSEHAGGLRLPQGPAGVLYVECEGQGGAALPRLERAIAAIGADDSQAQLVGTSAERRHFAELRHLIPDTLNRRGAALAERGGGKISTDWSVPLQHLDDLLSWTELALTPLGLRGCWAYGHIGDGHPHLNLLCSDAASRAKAQAVLHEQLLRVVELGGSPVSEHGVGKLKRDLIGPWLPAGFAAAFTGLKAAFDPDGTLAPGNIATVGQEKT